MAMLKEGYIYLDQDGRDLYEAEIAALIGVLEENENNSQISIETSTNYGYHDNGSSKSYSGKHSEVQYRLGLLKDDEVRIIEIEKHNISDAVDLGDTLIVLLTPSGGKQERIEAKLVARHIEMLDEKNKINLNQPLGAAVYMKKVGDQIKYNDFGKETTGIIESLTKELVEPAKRKIR